MRIAYVITRSDEIGGAHIHVRDLAKWMQRRGHEVCVFVGGHGPFTKLLNDANIPNLSLKQLKRSISPLSDWRAIKELACVLRDYCPNLVSLHSAKAGLLGRIACSRLPASVLFTAHGWSFAPGVPQPARSVYLLLERRTASMADKIITVCDNDRDYALQQKVGNRNQLVTVHNGMPDISVKLMAAPVNPVPSIVMVARFEKQKDHTTLLEALVDLKDIKWMLRLVGDGPLIEHYQNVVKQYGLDNRVEFMGRCGDVPEILSAADIFVLTSFWEGFPRSILEAMRASLPVIASRVAGVPEAVDEGKTGFLVDVGDIEQLRIRLRQLIENPDLRETLGKNSRLYYEKSFTFQRMAERTLRIYESVVDCCESSSFSG